MPIISIERAMTKCSIYNNLYYGYFFIIASKSFISQGLEIYKLVKRIDLNFSFDNMQ